MINKTSLKLPSIQTRILRASMQASKTGRAQPLYNKVGNAFLIARWLGDSVAYYAYNVKGKLVCVTSKVKESINDFMINCDNKALQSF